MTFAFAALMLIAAPVAAQDHSGHTMPAAPAAATTKFSVDTPIEQIAADPKAKAVLDDAVPGLTAHAMYDQFKSMSLAQLQPMSGGQLTDEQIAKAKTGLAAIK